MNHCLVSVSGAGGTFLTDGCHLLNFLPYTDARICFADINVVQISVANISPYYSCMGSIKKPIKIICLIEFMGFYEIGLKKD